MTLVFVGLGSAATANAAPPVKDTPTKDTPTKDSCIDDADEGQSLRDAGKLREARSKFVSCANPACPAAVAKECSAWLSDVESRMPTVVFRAVDALGADLTDVKVSLDGQPFVERLSGTQVRIDPGPHRLRYEYTAAAGIAPVEDNVVIYERQTGRSLEAKFLTLNATAAGAPAPGAESATPKTSSAPVAAYIVGGVGILALGSAAFFGLRGSSDYHDLKDGCGKTHSCATSDIDAVNTKFTIADISLAAGVVAVGVATYLYFSHPKESDSPRTSSKSSAVLTPLRGGGWLAGYETKF